LAVIQKQQTFDLMNDKVTDDNGIEEGGAIAAVESTKRDIVNEEDMDDNGIEEGRAVESTNQDKLNEKDIEDNGIEEGAIAGVESNNRDITEVTTQSYGSELKDSCSGACFGFILYFVSITLLIWNEGRTVKRMKDIDEGRQTILEFDLNNFTNVTIPTAFDNQLIHAVGDLSTKEILTDPIFGVSSQYNSTNMTTVSQQTIEYFLKLSRSVDMYQWKETSSSTIRHRADGSTYTVTTYSHSKVWSSSLINSGKFHERSTSMTNPGSFPFDELTLESDPIYVGNKIILNDEIVSWVNWYEPYDMIEISRVPDTTLQSRLTKHTSNGYFYRSGSSTSTSSIDRPNVGDARITFDIVLPDTISIIAKLYPDIDNDGSPSLGTHTTTRGGELLLIERGTYTAEEMLTQADNENTTIAWILRVVGFVLNVFSILLILQPLATIVDIVPFIGDFIQSTMENCLFPLIAVIIALPTCLFVIALSWLAYRPYVAIPIAVGSLLLIVLFYWRIHKKKQGQQNDDNNEINPNNDDDNGPVKPNNEVDNGNISYPDSYSPFNSPGHNNITNTTASGKNDDVVEDDFAGALDHPLPVSTTNKPPDKKNNNSTEEADIVFQ
jgi:Transmembrane protein 43